MELIEQHGAALEFDLLTMTGYQLRDIGGALQWGALHHFVMHLPRTSALSRELVPITEEERWANGERNATILADIFDVIASGISALVAKGTGRGPKKIHKYPRPWLKPKVRRVGKGAIPVKDFESWWNGG